MRHTSHHQLTTSLSCILEESEAIYWSKYYATDTELKCFATTVAGAFAGAVPEVDILALNRVIGLGTIQPLEEAHLDALIHFYDRAQARRFLVQLAPNALAENQSKLLRAKGFHHLNNWVKLYRTNNEPLPEVETECTVEEIDATQALTFGKIITDSFEWKDPRLARWLARSVGTNGYRHYLAYYRGRPISAAALHLSEHYASMAFAGTLPTHRKMGAQNLLLQRRISDAMKAGSRYLIAETAQPTKGKSVASYRNMRRFGFQVAYARPNWQWTF